MQWCRFAVDTKPFCVWDHDLRDRNLGFLDGLDPGYFMYLAESHLEAMEGKNAKRAALALRAAYHHAIESLMALIFASVQAPGCVPGWLHKYEITDLRNLLTKARNHQPILTCVPIPESGWHGIAQAVLRFMQLEDREKEAKIKRGFGDAWLRFASDFLEPNAAQEYNSIKHGFRARSGGFRLAIGVEDTPGVPAPPEKMQLMGGSEHGSTFFVPERIGQSKMHLRLRSVSRNWLPMNLAHGLALIEMSLRNVVSFVKILNRVDPRTVQYVWPTGEEDPFWLPWSSESPGVTDISGFDTSVSEKDIKAFTQEEILSVYARTDEPDVPAAPSSP